jgi:hypothetical protein
MMDYIVHNLFSTEAGVVWLVLKWALVVLAAGFIGQFGKAFAAYLIRRAGEGKKKEVPPPAVREEGRLPAGQRPAPVAAAGEAMLDAGAQESGKAIKVRQKAEKKAAKAIKKFFK